MSHTTEELEKEGGSIDILVIFVGFFSTILALVLTSIKLLLDSGPQLSAANEAALSPGASLAFFAAISALLFIAALFNDLVTLPKVRKFILNLAPLCALASVAAYFCGAVDALSFACIGITSCLLVIIWGTVLATLNSHVLIIMLMLSCALSGVVVLMDAQLTTAQFLVLIALLSIISWLTVRRVLPTWIERITYASRQQSIERHVRGRGNSFTLVLVGSLFGSTAVMIRIIQLSTQELALTLGGSLLLSGAIVAFAHSSLHTRLGDILKRTLALIMIVGLAPFVFVEREGQILCVSVLFIAGTINLILIIDSILETSRFNQISTGWIIGLEGGVFLAALLTVVAGSFALLNFTPLGLEFLIIVLAILASVLQIYINNQAYPIFTLPLAPVEILPEAPNAHEQPLAPAGTVEEQPLLGSAFWRVRIEEIALRYRLSVRQREIMECLIKGRDLNYITVRFGISRSTAKTHVSNLYRKMNVHSKQELIDLMEPFEDEGTLS